MSGPRYIDDNHCAVCPLPADCLDSAAQTSPCENPLSSDYYLPDEEAVERLLWHNSELPLEERLACAGERLLGTPYAFDPLGEGSSDPIDPDPLYSLGALDCMTYVEEVMALSSGVVDFESFLGDLGEVRYTGGAELYGMRRHFVSADWLPENVATGRVRDITFELVGDDAEYASMVVDRAAWMERKELDDFDVSRTVDELRHIGKDGPELAFMAYIPLSELYEKVGDELYPNETLLDMLPDVSIALLVRPQRYVEKYGTIVAHMGFLVFERCDDGSRGELMLRHGSSKSGMIVEEPFLPYIDSQSKYRAGVTVLEILNDI